MTPDMKVAQEAREWFVRLLDDDISAEELAAWQAWLARSPAHREASDRVAESWAAAGVAASPGVSAGELAADRYDGSAPVAGWRAPRRWRPGLAAAGIAAAAMAGAALLGLADFRPGEAQAITTARAEHRTAALADGSRIDIGALTGVQVRMTDARREIQLDSGEAYFKVAKDKARPFVVETPFGAVTAVGTAFNVDVGARGMTLNVTEGVVLVRPYARALPPGLRSVGARPVRVEAGQQLALAAAGLGVAAKVQAAASGVTWPDGRREYRAEPLRSVIEDVNRYAERQIVLRDPAVGELAYTGAVRLDATEDWAAALPGAFPLEVTRGEDGVIVISERM